MGYFAWHDEPGYWRDVTRHFAPGARMLDVGCGSAWLAEHFEDYTGVDGSPEAVAAAAKRGRRVLLGTVMERLPFDDASFDGVVVKDLLEHVEDPVFVVREVLRVLRPGEGCSPRRPTPNAGSGTTTRTAGRSHARRSACCSPTKGSRSSASATSR